MAALQLASYQKNSSTFEMTEAEALEWIAELFEESSDAIQADTPRDDVPAWDSLGVLSLIAALDQRCGIVLSGEEIEKMTRIDDILEVLRVNKKLE